MESLLVLFIAAAGLIHSVDAVHCIRIQEQNAQMKPSMLPHNANIDPRTPPPLRDHTFCRYGSIPIHNFTAGTRKAVKAPSLVPETSATLFHKHAVAFARGRFRGFKTTINIWKPQVEQAGEFSLSQLWLISSYDSYGNPRSTIEAGWQVYPNHYGGRDPRLFVYWTADGYGDTGCYNLDCDGFVQINSSYVLGGPISSETSIAGSTQVEAEFFVFQDPETSNWWLRVAGIYIGYWKASVVPDFASGASAVSCGGEVLEVKARRHTRTQMGSGAFPTAHYRYAAYHRDIQIVNENFRLQPAHSMGRAPVKAPGCYDIGLLQHAGSRSSWGTYFFYGGPGYSSRCD